MHCPSFRQLDVQTWLLQNGVSGVPAQSAPTLHCTHALVVTSQTGLPGTRAHADVSLALHCSQVPGPAWGTHAGFAAVGHFEVAAELKLPLHAVHVLLVQTGAADGHVALVTQFTHTFVARSQTVLVGSFVQVTGTVGSFELHSAHAPLGRHAGKASLQGNLLVALTAEPKLPVQPTHLLVVVSHEPLVPVQAEELPSVHSRHAPLTQAGSAAVGQAVGLGLPGLKSPVQEVQPLAMQTGRPAGHWAEVAHD